jgi:hypothetical protein
MAGNALRAPLTLRSRADLIYTNTDDQMHLAALVGQGAGPAAGAAGVSAAGRCILLTACLPGQNIETMAHENIS